ncbi:MAG: hypothetical protein DMF98_08635, partial [Acidobacteria bacterium]
GQHIFLFMLNEDGKKALLPKVFEKHFTEAPAKPHESFYAQYPAAKRTIYELRDDRFITVKQIYTTHYWERNEEKSQETETQRTVIYDRIRRRSINLFRLDMKSSEVEVRVDHVHSKDEKLARQMLDDFRKDLLKVVDFDEHLVPVPVVAAFPGIIAVRDETFMSVDEAFDMSASMRFANRREETKGKDIRDHPSHTKAIVEKSVARQTVRVYWLIGKGDHQRKVHSIISTVEIDGKNGDSIDYAKAYIPAKVDPADLGHVIARIRYFAG